MVVTGIVTPFAAIPSIAKLYFTHSKHASGQSLITWCNLCLRESPVVGIRIAQQKTTDIRRERNIICNESTDGERHPDACWMDLLRSSDAAAIHSPFDNNSLLDARIGADFVYGD